AYRSFGGEVEASSTPTICRLPDSRRHQLWAIALRAMGSRCRQQAAYNGMNKWKLLAEAEYWEHLAELELSSYFQQCNAACSNERTEPQARTEANDDSRWETIAAEGTATTNDAQCALMPL
ncbi:hypothetical protein, partial [Bradyrhizobium sp. 143]